jgi:hypothetical protein
MLRFASPGPIVFVNCAFELAEAKETALCTSLGFLMRAGYAFQAIGTG